MKMINLQTKDKLISISEEELESITVEEWFLSLQLKYLDLESDNPTLQIDEEYEIFKDILDSFKFRTLIISDIKKIYYYEKLSEKWVFPEWLIQEIQEKIMEQNKFASIKKELLELQECKNCKKIYKESENNSTACQFHPGVFSVSHFTCCGFRPQNNGVNNYCRQSYHSPDKFKTLTFLEAYLKLFPEDSDKS